MKTTNFVIEGVIVNEGHEGQELIIKACNEGAAIEDFIRKGATVRIDYVDADDSFKIKEEGGRDYSWMYNARAEDCGVELAWADRAQVPKKVNKATRTKTAKELRKSHDHLQELMSATETLRQKAISQGLVVGEDITSQTFAIEFHNPVEQL